MSFIREIVNKNIIDVIRKKRSKYWPKVRKRFLLNNNRCACCGRKNGLEVHHIKPFHLNPELELDYNNLITLCGKSCHLLIGHLRNWKAYNDTVKEDSNNIINKILKRKYK